MTGVQILLMLVALFAISAAVTVVWIRNRRTGGVLIAEVSAVTIDDGGRP